MKLTRLFAVIATLFTLTLTAQPALATSPHFVSGSGSITSNPALGSLSVTFQEAGLGSGLTVYVQATATQIATWGCINHGNNHPQGLDTATTPVSSPSTPFTVPHNGTIKGSVTIAGPTDPPANFSCPAANMIVVLVGVSYSDVTISDLTTPAGPFSVTSGTLSITFFK